MKIDEIRSLDMGALVRERVERDGLRAFVKHHWQFAQPGTPFKDNWCLGAICEFLEAFARRQIVNGIISVPPRHGKTLASIVMFPCWTWTWQPEHRFILGNFDQANLKRDASQTVQILTSELYRSAWPGVETNADAASMYYIETKAGGLRKAVTTGKTPTGEGGHTRVFDDPISVKQKRSEAHKLAVSNWWKGMSSRRSGGIEFGSLGIMQRIAADDLAGECLDNGYEHLMLPLEYIPNAHWDMGCSLGKLDTRTEPGELLMPEVWSKDDTDKMKKDLGSEADVQAQYQQNPVPDSGGIIERAWFRRWTSDQENKEERLPPPFKMVWCDSWDLGFEGETDAHSRVAAALMARCRVNGLIRYFVVTGWAKHLNYPETKAEFRRLLGGYKDGNRNFGKRLPGVQPWTYSRVHLVEKKANGHALIQELKAEIPGIRATNPEDSKGDRLILHSDKFSDGEVWLPPEALCPQIKELENELVFFPNGDYDDFVDVVTQGLDHLAGSNAGFWENMRKLQETARR